MVVFVIKICAILILYSEKSFLYSIISLAWPIAAAGALGYLLSGWNVPGLPAGTVGFWYVPCIVVLGVCTVLFAPLGVKAAHRLPPAVLKRVFGVLMVVIGSQMLWKLLHGA